MFGFVCGGRGFPDRNGEDSGSVIERIVSICNPHNGLFGNFVIHGLFGNLVIPNSKVAKVGISGAKKPKSKGFLV
jgi:hypothetical protein